MARYLSPEWFTAVRATGPHPDGPARLLIEQRVFDTPDGEVTYRVVVGRDSASIVWPVAADSAPPDIRISCDWATAVAMAKGDLSTQKALMEGKLKVRGNPSRMAGDDPPGLGFDPVPEAVRGSTTY